ncbi:MAG TPA: glycosyltransferase family 87 protein [Candidatus Dormibacteraeota bacterium]|nr:glycosyltransferase family 87 protein [Candidatus Dormibacteraeota bacterium]
MTGLEPSLQQRWRNLAMAAGAVTAALFAVFDLYQWALAYAGDRFHNDFTFYYAAARIGLAHGWPAIYDLHLQQAELDTIGSGIKIAELARYISPPPVAWSALPLTPLPYPVAYWIWSALLLIALVLTWRLASPGHGPWRLVHLAAAVGWLPVIYGLQLGQPGLFVALGVAACYALLKAERPFWAGVALGALALKPQLAFLVPVALLVGGRTRAFWGSVVALGVLGLASAIALGPSGIGAYQARLTFAAGVPVNRELTLAPLLGSLEVTRVIQAAIALWALFLVYRLRRRGHEWIFIPALVGGLLASPYLHLDDLAMLGLAAWLYVRTSPRAWTLGFVLAVVVAAEGLPLWGPVPLIAGELGALVLLSVNPRGVPRLPQSDAPPVGPRPTPALQVRPDSQPAPPHRG